MNKMFEYNIMNCSKTNELLSSIDISLSDANKTKIYFNATLTDGNQQALDRIDYTSSPIIFEWQNDKGVPVYINHYLFSYEDNNNTEPTSTETYHSTAFTTKVGAVNSAGTDFEEPYATMENNMWYSYTTSPKRSFFSDVNWAWRYDFNIAPIEIGVSRKFGHYIAGDFSIGDYDSNPIGIVEGYYYND